MNTFSHVPPGFRFHPTDEELVDYYLRKKVSSKRIELDVIKDVDLYKIEPWDLQEMCRIGREEENEWYLFSHKDKKYPTGTRTNRATGAGFWKATGRDKGIYSKKQHELIGMRKTLVFYKGRAPNGQKSDWIMHEYRLETDENATPQQEEGWVVCRVFKKRVTTTTWMRKVMMSEHESLSQSQSQSESPPCCWYEDQVPLMPAEFDDFYSCSLPPNKKELDQQYQMPPSLHLPLLQTPKHHQMAPPYGMMHHLNHATSSLLPCSSPLLIQEDQHFHQAIYAYGAAPPNSNNNSQLLGVAVHHHQVTTTTATTATATATDWRVLDKFVASQLSQDDDDINTSKDDDINSYSSSSNNIFKQLTHHAAASSSKYY